MPYLKETLDKMFEEWIATLNGETEYDQPQSNAFEAGFRAGIKYASQQAVQADAICQCEVVDLTKTIAHCSVCGGSLNRTA